MITARRHPDDHRATPPTRPRPATADGACHAPHDVCIINGAAICTLCGGQQ